MAVSSSTQQNIRKALGALKDRTKVGLAKVNSDYKDLDVAIVKATNHVEQLAKEKHIRCIFEAVSASRPRVDVMYCISSLARRLNKTSNWAVALKILMVIHRALREVDSTFRVELINYSRSRGHLFNITHFKDDSSQEAWDYSAWVRSYALYLEERLECYYILKYDVECERCKFQEVSTFEMLEHLSALLQLLFRLVGCQPEGAARDNKMIRYALSMVANEGTRIYKATNMGILSLVDEFFDMQQRNAAKTLEIYRKAAQQVERLAEFYNVCRIIDLAGAEEFPKIEQPLSSFITEMEAYAKEPPVNSMPGTTENVLVIEDKKADENHAITSSSLMVDRNCEGKSTEVSEQAQSAVADLLCLLDDVYWDAENTNIGNDPAADETIVEDGVPHDPTSPGTGWELALVNTQGTNDDAVTKTGLVAGGFDRKTLDSLYDDAIAKGTSADWRYHPVANPYAFGNPQFSHDQFFAKGTVAPPSHETLAAEEQKQQRVAQDNINPFF